MKMLVFRDADVLRGKCPVHLGGGIDGVGHRPETRQQTVAQALHQDAAMARQYLGGDDTDKVCPSANGGGFVLSHEPHRFHEVDQQDDGLLPDKSNACVRERRMLGPSALLVAFVHRVLDHGDPASRSGVAIFGGM